jgi:prepilin-type processing-associated H-X9-DG protein
MKRKKQFTMAEVVVISLVTLTLAVVALSGLFKKHELYRRAVCLSHLRQIGVAIGLYTSDNLNYFPNDAEGTTVGSATLLTNHYQTSYEAWVCPSDIGVVAGSASQPFTSANLSYAYGAFGQTESCECDAPVMCDRSSQGDPTTLTPWLGNQWTHKSDGGNVLFCDGHASFRKTMHTPMLLGKNP